MTGEDMLSHNQPADRSGWRDTFIYSSRDRTTVIGGLWTAKGITNANLYSMVEIVCIFSETFVLHDDNEQLIESDGQQLQPGKYYIVTHGSIGVTDEVPLTRTSTLPSGTRVTSFRDAVRERDRGCVITGRAANVATYGYWWGFDATHIFPLAHEAYWNDHNYGCWITVPPTHESNGSINSVQNGILLRSDIRVLFDCYALAINPDDNYKIVCFTPADLGYRITGQCPNQTFLDNSQRPVDELLRWHFRQAVLVNVKRGGEPGFETDFPPGSDIMGEIMSGPKASERMEFELFSRFNAMGNCA
ncbi:hypothetical protein HOY80DRAFT_911835 [Tuber brumale]|nr:hypothetical protein HOY80DRAFT_911835 [Tuber brumale]